MSTHPAASPDTDPGDRMENACCSRPLFCPSQSEGSDWNPKSFPGVSPSLPSPCLSHTEGLSVEGRKQPHTWSFPSRDSSFQSQGWSDQRKQRMSSPLSPAIAATTAAESLRRPCGNSSQPSPGRPHLHVQHGAGKHITFL